MLLFMIGCEFYYEMLQVLLGNLLLSGWPLGVSVGHDTKEVHVLFLQKKRRRRLFSYSYEVLLVSVLVLVSSES